MRLSILIPSTPDRRPFLLKLTNSLSKQIRDCNASSEVEILINETALFDKNDPKKELSIGYKRNKLLQKACGHYVAFIDSDDRVSDDYICLLFEGIEKNPDCCSLVGEYTKDGKNAKLFYHSIKHNRYWEDEKGYYRFPNHLNCIRASIAKQFKFPEIMVSEDTDFATQIHRSGLLKTEFEIPSIIYYYDDRTK